MEGWQFAAELSQLRVVGQVDQPALGWTYASMNRAVDSTASGQAAAFQAPGGGVAASEAAWSALRDDLQNVLGRTAGSLQDAAVTVLHIVQAYAAADAAARGSLESAWANGQTPGLLEAEEKFSYHAPPPVILKDGA
jgi:hypothetical protein